MFDANWREVLGENPLVWRDFVLAAAAAIVLLAVAGVVPKSAARWLPVTRWLGRLARRRRWTIVLVGLTSLVISVVTTLISGVPVPRVHDEFSYLLAADTFARGRLTNPQHPLWRHFETMHVLHEPTYQSKFGVAQPMALALGQALTGEPVVGAWISTALACAATTWALYGWTRPRWAAAGGLVAALHPHVIHWGQMYWGGGVGMTAGALILGSIPRVIRRQRPRDAALGALGLAILINSRPYEAMVWGVLGVVTFLTWLLIPRAPRRAPGELLARVVAPALAVLLPVGAFMMYYNWRVTGDVRQMPYTLHTRQYMSVPLFFWSDPAPPKTYRHRALHDQYQVWEHKWFNQERTSGGFLAWTVVKAHRFLKDFVVRVLPLAVGLVALPWAVRRDGWTRLALVYAAAFAVAWAIIPWFTHHYAGAVVALLILLSLRGLRGLSVWRPRGRPVGRACVALLLASCVPVLAPTLHRQHRENTRPGWWQDRARIIDELRARGGRHLVIFRYGPDHSAFDEWVFNGADLEHAPVILAREMSPEENAELIGHYEGRGIWLLEADAPRPQPVPYPLTRPATREGTIP